MMHRLYWILTCATTCGTTIGAAAEPDPRIFVQHLYDRYARGADGASPLGDSAADVFDPALLRLIRAAQARAAGQAGLLDYDPICDCQDPDGFGGLRVTGGESRGGTASATAKFRISADRVTVGYTLKHTKLGWRVADIRTGATPSFKGWLKSALEKH